MRLTNAKPDDILVLKFDKDDLKFYVRTFLPYLIMAIVMPVILILMGHLKGRNMLIMYIGAILIFLFQFGLMAVLLTIHFIKSNMRRKEYHALVDKYGRDNLTRELSGELRGLFMLHPEKVETYEIITDNYFISSRTIIIRLDEISDFSIDYAHPRGDTIRPYDNSKKSPRETVRFVKMMTVKDINGHSNTFPIALSDEDLAAFDGYLRSVLAG